MGVDGRLHGNRAHQLQRVVLHHVAQRAGLVVESAPFFDAQVFGNGDLDVGNVLTPPEWLEQRVAKTHGKQVLHRRFAQVMVDAKHLPFGQHLPHGGVDGAVGGEVVAQGFFQHHPHVRAVQAHGGNLLHDGGEQRRGGGQVHHHRICVTCFEQFGQPGVVLRVGQIHTQVVQHGGELRKFFRSGAFGTFHRFKPGLDQRTVRVVVQIVTAHANDASAFRQAAVPEGLEQSGHQLAPGQVAGAAKQDKVKAHGSSCRWVNGYF